MDTHYEDLMDAHRHRRLVPIKPVAQDQRPAHASPICADVGPDTVMAIRVHGLGFLVIRAIGNTGSDRFDRSRETRMSIITDAEAQGA